MSADADLSLPLAKSLVEVARGRVWDALDQVRRALAADGPDWRERFEDASADLANARVTHSAAQDRYILVLEAELANARAPRAA